MTSGLMRGWGKGPRDPHVQGKGCVMSMVGFSEVSMFELSREQVEIK